MNEHFTDEERLILQEYVISIRKELFKEPVPDEKRAELLLQLEERLREHPIFQKHLKRIHSDFDSRVHDRMELLKQQAGILTEKHSQKQKVKHKGMRRLVIFISLLSMVFAGFACSFGVIFFNITLALIAFVFTWIVYFFIRYVLWGFRDDLSSYIKARDVSISILKWIIILLFAGLIFYFASGNYGRILI
jgi:cation transport ATPase